MIVVAHRGHRYRAIVYPHFWGGFDCVEIERVLASIGKNRCDLDKKILISCDSYVCIGFSGARLGGVSVSGVNEVLNRLSYL